MSKQKQINLKKTKEVAKIRKTKLKKSRAALNKYRAENGMKVKIKPTISNCKCKYKTVEEEKDAVNSAVEGQLEVFRGLLPSILLGFSKIKDYRQPKKIKHMLDTILLYGLLMFVYQMTSRRESTREMTRPMFMENLKVLFPEIETIPHHDTLNRVLEKIDVDEIENTSISLIRKLIRNKKFKRYMNEGTYQIAIDGTQKFTREYRWEDEALERKVKGKTEGEKQYYVYVLEANLVFSNGIQLTLVSEFLNYDEFKSEQGKQDCEIKAFYRLAKRIKELFPKLAIMILGDGIYANGIVMELCKKYGWQFMIVLQDASLKTVWREFHSLKDYETGNTNKLTNTYNDRIQEFTWVNDITYEYEVANKHMEIDINIVVCEEKWMAMDENTTELVEKHSKYAWISSKKITKQNVLVRCNLCARQRWAIESCNQVEKHQGYSYTHCFSYDWNAMRGYHYLMRLAHLMNELMINSINLLEDIKEHGIRGFIKFIKQAIASPWIDTERIKTFLNKKLQIRLI